MSNCSGPFRAHGLAHAAFFLVLLAWAAASTAQAILENDIVDPRTFGYAVGDKIRREVHLSLRSGYRLDEASLPEAGRLDRWLELAAPQLSTEAITDGRRYRVILTYQIFNAPPVPQTITIPRQDLRILGEEQVLTALVPALRVNVAPLTSTSPDRVTASSLQPDRPPAPIPVAARQTRFAWTSAGLLTLLLYAAGRLMVTASKVRRDRPFATAVRELKRLRPATDAPAPAQSRQYAAGLRIVHEAINRTAGRAVFAHNLDEFLAAQPRYAHLRDNFDRLFAASGRIFFAGAAADRPPDNALPALLRLCRLCSTVERRSLAIRPSGKLHEPGN